MAPQFIRHGCGTCIWDTLNMNECLQFAVEGALCIQINHRTHELALGQCIIQGILT